MNIKSLLSFILIFFISNTLAEINLQKKQTDDGNSINSLENFKFLPTPNDIGGEDSRFGMRVSISGNRALVGAPYMAGTGLVFVYEYSGNTWNEVGKLTPSDGESGDRFGTSVSLYGNRAVIGAPNKDTGSGSVYVYDFIESNWLETQRLIASDTMAYDSFGYSISLFDNKVLIGAYGDDDNGSLSGSAYIFEFIENTWIEVEKLIAPDGAQSDKFGESVSLIGNRALIGSPKSDSDRGSAYIFQYSVSGWTFAQKLIAEDRSHYDFFGKTVLLFPDGNRAMIGAPYKNVLNSNFDLGAAYFFEFNSVEWVESQKIIPKNGTDSQYFGISISAESNKMIIGASGAVDNVDRKGSAYTFEQVEGTWVEKEKIVQNELGELSYFGGSVGVSGDKSIIGASGAEESGSAYFYSFNDPYWEYVHKISAPDGAALDKFGTAISYYGNKVLIGAPHDNNFGKNSGSAYIFEYIESNWVLNQKIQPVNPMPYKEFGNSVSLLEDRALIGASGFGTFGSESGSVYTFQFNGVEWVQTQEIKANDEAAGDFFGHSFSLNGDRALIGAYGDEDNGVLSGSAYLFSYVNGEWVQNQKLVAYDGGTYDRFGFSLSIMNEKLLVGAYRAGTGEVYAYDFDGVEWIFSQKITSGENSSGSFGYSVSQSSNRVLIGAYTSGVNNTGWSYLFDHDGDNWVKTSKIIAPDGNEFDFFGKSVFLSGNRLIIGAPGDDNLHKDLGSAYVYEFEGDSWKMIQKFKAPDGASFDRFGSSVILSEDLLFVGSVGDDDSGTDSGSVYLMRVEDLIYRDGFEK